MERDVALGRYKVRARFRSDEEASSAWKESAEFFADGKTDVLDPPELTVVAAPGGYWLRWDRPDAAYYDYTEVYDRPGSEVPQGNFALPSAGWTLRGSASGVPRGPCRPSEPREPC